jgi:isoquinoline 1-oxidoreductase beta subunit
LIMSNTSRRNFVIGTGAVAGALVIGFNLPRIKRVLGTGGTGAAGGLTAGAAGTEFKPNAFVRVGADNNVTVIVGMSEMGQGVRTSLPQIVAEELDVDWTHIRVEQADADDAFKNPLMGMQATGGSMSVRAFWDGARQAGATARAMLVSAAAAEWGVDAATLRTEGGAVINGDKRLSYGQLAAKASTLAAPAKVTLKDPKDFRLIGKALPRTDLAGKVNGTAGFGLDVRVPNMLTAVILRPTTVGAKVASFNADKAMAMPGVKKVVQIDSGIAVLATGFYAAKAARDVLEVKWTASPLQHLSTADMSKAMAALAKKPGMVAQNDGNVATAKATKTISAVYEAPYLAHAPMEPQNCTVSVTAGACEVWAPTQAPGPNRAVLAGLLGIPPEKVSVHVTFLGGGFGRRFSQDFVVDAALLSKAAGAPVQLVYTREDDMHTQHYRPMVRAEFSAGLDAAGNPVSFRAHPVSSSVMASSGFGKPGTLDDTAVEGLKGIPYDIPNINVQWTAYEPGIKVWFWRSVGSSQNGFFAESFVDELAHAAGKDPLEYRRALLSKKPRHLKVLNLAAEQAGWGTALPAGRARGIAVVESFGSVVAEVAEVSLVDGKPRVHRVVAAVDCGTAVNPGIISRQIASAVMYGLSAALFGKITVKDGSIEQGNFDSYPVVRLNEAPAVEVHVVPSTEHPSGVGEPGLPPLAPAVGNALFVLTGQRLRSLPLTLQA